MSVFLMDVIGAISIEIVIPLTVVSVIFWSMALPRCQLHAAELASSVVKGMMKQPSPADCAWLLEIAPRMDATRSDLVNSDNVGTDALFAVNILIILIFASLAVLVPFTLPSAISVPAVLEIFAIYIIITSIEVYFALKIAYNYSPVKLEDISKIIVSSCPLHPIPLLPLQPPGLFIPGAVAGM